MGRATVVEIEHQRRKLLDEFAELHRQVEAFKPKAQRHEDLRKQILSWRAEEPAANQVEVSGDHFRVVFSPRGKQRSIVSMAKVFKLCGQKRFLDMCKFPLEALDLLFKEPAQIGLVREDLSGPRKVLAVIEASEPAAVLKAA